MLESLFVKDIILLPYKLIEAAAQLQPFHYNVFELHVIKDNFQTFKG